MPIGVKTVRRRWRATVAMRAAALRRWPHGDIASRLSVLKRPFSKSVVLFAALSMLLAPLFSSRVNAYGIVAWTAAARGAPSDPDAFPGMGLLLGSHALAIDAGGNAYVTGTAKTGINGELLTIKYGPGGVAQWRAFADGDQPGNGSASAIAVDSSGNVYVAGVGGYGDVTSRVGFLTIKYDPSGAQVWRVLDAEPNNAYADALAIDPAGNVLVTGRVFVPLVEPYTFRIDYLTIKYDASGAEQWRATVSDAVPSNNTSNVTSLGLDASGNSYLIAMTDSNGKVGYLAVSYDANGNERWRTAPKASQTSEDYLNGAAVDASGNAYLTGTSLDGNALRSFTIKYDSSGAEQWRSSSAIGETSNAVTVDNSGNVYTAGAGQNLGTSYAVVTKYSPSGIQQWRTVSLGDANHPLNTYAVAVDATGRVYATGTAYNGADWDFWTIKYSSSGVEQWRKTASGGATGDDFAYALKIDATGNAYITGSSDKGGNHDWLTIKYNAAGNEQWRANEGVVWTDAAFASGFPWSWRHGMAADIQGNVYVIGYVEPVNFQDDVDFLTVKFDANGNELWRANPGPTNVSNLGHALAVDTSGSVYVTGTSEDGIGNDIGYLTVKYSTSGQELWRAISHNAGAFDQPMAITADASHNVYVTGSSHFGLTTDYFTVKYDANGVEQWRQATRGAVDGNYLGKALAVDGLGNVYVSGFGSGQGGTDCLTVSYDATGTERWRATCNYLLSTSYTDISAIALDGSGDVYVTGTTFAPNVFEFVTIKYSSSGSLRWLAFGYKGDGYHSAFVSDLVVDAAGNAHVVGTIENGVDYDYLTIKYDPYGNERWRAHLPNVVDSYTGPSALAVDIAGNVYVTAGVRNGQRRSYVTVKYDPGGVELWRTFSNNAGRDESTYSLALGSGNATYLAGQSFGPTAPPYMVVQKLVEGVLPSATTLASAQNPSAAGQAVAFTAVISGYLPKGTVNFTYDATPITGCSAVAVTAAQASCNAVLAVVGTHSIAAAYSGDNNNASSTSAPVLQVVLAATTTTVTSSLNPSVLGQAVTLTATVVGTRPTGTVDFRDGATPICTAVTISGPKGDTKSANCNTTTLGIGSHSITASYSGDNSNAGSTSPPLTQTVTPPPPGISLTSSLNPSKPGDSVTFTAKVTAQAPTGMVTFNDGSGALCSAAPLQGGGNTPVATCTTGALTVGSHSITAAYSGDANNSAATSSVLTQTVKRPKR